MSKRRLSNLIRKGMLTMQTLLTSTQLLNIVDRECILSTAAILFKENLITEINLDEYIVNVWITSEEKVLIINEANTI